MVCRRSFGLRFRVRLCDPRMPVGEAERAFQVVKTAFATFPLDDLDA